MSAEPALVRLRELGDRYGLSARMREQLLALLAVLDGQARAPTSVRSPERAVDVHIADSLVALEIEAVRDARSIADIGAGAGFPGLAVAVAVPAAAVCLIESQARKCAFLRDAIAAMGLGNARPVCARAEQWGAGAGAGAHDLVLARAVAAQPVVLEYAAPLLRAGGTLVDWRGRRLVEEEAAAESAAVELGLRRLEIRSVAPFAGAREHNLHVFAKVGETPARFPRRPGIARKRPLGGRAAPRRERPFPHFAGNGEPPGSDRC